MNEIQVQPDQPWAWWDRVFDEDYPLMTLSETEAYIKKHSRLPDMPGEKEVNEEGINVLEMDGLLLKKIEELTLHMIKLEKQNRKLQDENKSLSQKVGEIEEVKKELYEIKGLLNNHSKDKK